MPYSLRIVCGFFNVPQLFKGCEKGPAAYSPYPRRQMIHQMMLPRKWATFGPNTSKVVLLGTIYFHDFQLKTSVTESR